MAQTRRWLGLVLLVYGSVGIVVMLRLLPLLAQAVSLWLGSSGDAPRPGVAFLGPLEAHYDPRPWLGWAAWLLGLLLVAPPPQWLKGLINHPSDATPMPGSVNPTLTDATPTQGVINHAPTDPTPAPAVTPDSKLKTQNSKLLIPALLIILIIGVGAYTRLNLLVPQEKGLIEYPYDDEGVYAEASQLTLQGILPYRDYFFAHPPLASLVYIPAFAYHFNAWGSPTSFMLGRYLSVGYSLLTALALFLLGRKAAQGMGVGGLPADFVGGLAALLWAIDGQVVEINRKVMLDQPMVLFSSLGLLFYLYALPQGDERAAHDRRWLILAGVFVALAALTKIAGLAAGLALFTHAIATALERCSPSPQPSPQMGEGDAPPPPRPSPDMGEGVALRPRWFNLKWLTLGFAATAALIVLPYLALAGGPMVREVVFFQLLRPGDGTTDVAARLPLITGAIAGAITANPLTLICAVLGCLALGWRVARGTRLGGWTSIILWNIFSFALFTYTRSFYTHYYIQIAAPLCLLGGAAALWPEQRSRSLPALFYPAVSAVVAVLLVPTLLYQWGTTTQPHPNPMFRDVAKYITDAVPPRTNVLTLDDQYNFLAARPPSYLSTTGYLVDSYGHMIYLGLGIGGRSIPDLLGGVLHDPRSNDVYATIWRDVPQSDMLQRIASVPLIVTHDVGEGRLRQDTLAKLGQIATRQPDASTSRYTIYRKLGEIILDETFTLPSVFVQPDYRGGGTVNLSESILRHFGAAEAGMVGLRAELLPPALLDGASVVLMLIVDGLGYLQLAEQIAAGNAPNLARLLRARPATFQPITTTVPSMTSCALTTLHTAATPAQHGLVGWNLYLQEEGTVVDMLKFAPAAAPYSGEIESVNPGTFLPVPTIYQRLSANAVKAMMVNYGFLRETALTRIMHAGADYQNFVTSSDLCINIRKLAEQAVGPTFICGYWEKVDTVAHAYGSQSDVVAAEIAQFDFIVGRELLDKLKRKDVALLITADHGQITTPPQRSILSNADRELLRLLAQPPAGDNRTVYLHAKVGQAAALLDYARHRYGTVATVLTRAQFIASGLLGGLIAERYLSRIGDVVLLMHDSWRIRTLYYAEQAEQPPLIGMHGGMMAEEMYSTLIAARLG